MEFEALDTIGYILYTDMICENTLWISQITADLNGTFVMNKNAAKKFWIFSYIDWLGNSAIVIREIAPNVDCHLLVEQFIGGNAM